MIGEGHRKVLVKSLLGEDDLVLLRIIVMTILALACVPFAPIDWLVPLAPSSKTMDFIEPERFHQGLALVDNLWRMFLVIFRVANMRCNDIEFDNGFSRVSEAGQSAFSWRSL